MATDTNHTKNHIENLSTLCKAKGFLGREFLTWLWFIVETDRGTIEVTLPQATKGRQRKIKLEAWIDDRVVLESSAARVHVNVLKGGNPSQSDEASASLHGGKMVREMKLGLRLTDVGDFSAVLHCEDLSPRALRLPATSGEESTKSEAVESAVGRRLQLIDLFLQTLDGLFLKFMQQRLAKDWDEEGLSQIRQWIRKRSLQERDAAFH